MRAWRVGHDEKGSERERKRYIDRWREKSARVESGPRDVLGPVVSAPLRDVSVSPPCQSSTRETPLHIAFPPFSHFFRPRLQPPFTERRLLTTRRFGEIDRPHRLESRRRETSRVSLSLFPLKERKIGDTIDSSLTHSNGCR